MDAAWRIEVTPWTADAMAAGFDIVESEAVPGAAREIPPDLATCADCLRELFAPANRRYRYPFITCTVCGPRATIIESLPYDRARTSMRGFEMCPACAGEYHDPGDRRFHAEPIACPSCGPRLRFLSMTGETALRAAVDVVAGGGVVAVKGLGGFQLVCDAINGESVARLRRIKGPLLLRAHARRRRRRPQAYPHGARLPARRRDHPGPDPYRSARSKR
ncbi:Sua5/YciO/YrdC/YwlC family protein [Nonomuraea sp. 10N515B]|uniref:Sua5/YciO/YrdC/YwlC family protein n=1 Tax=Nonomuraea sp. 10N515B TaxID=3457422 RepID=UPI003FCCC00E